VDSRGYEEVWTSPSDHTTRAALLMEVRKHGLTGPNKVTLAVLGSAGVTVCMHDSVPLR
jgi:hypothetical protein